MRMTGACTIARPLALPVSRASPLAWARARVTATVTPASARTGSHDRCSASAATGPTTVIDGARMSPRWTVSAIVSKLPVTVRCAGRVPASTTAAGSSGARPASISEEAIWGSRRAPM